MTTSDAARRGNRPGRRAKTSDIGPSTGRLLSIILGGSLVVGVVLGLLWSQVVDPVQATVANSQFVVDEVAAAGWFDLDAWFGLLAAIAGLLVGGVSYLRYRQRPIAVIVLSVVGGLLGSAAAWQFGMLLGPDRVSTAAEGSAVPLPLALNAYGVLVIWPMAAMAAILLLNASLDDRTPLERRS